MADGGTDIQLSRDVARLQSQVTSLRILLLRVAVTVCLALLLVGLVLPAAHGTQDGKEQTVRVLTAGFQAFADDDGGSAAIALGIGFLGLLVVVLLLAGLLLQAGTTDDDWHPNRGSMVRNAVGLLAVVGTAVAVLLSAIAAGSDAPNASGGWGPVVLLFGVALSLVVLGSRPLREGL